jgi:hypothetical protein
VDQFYNAEFKEKDFNQIFELTSNYLKEYQTLPPYKKYYAIFDKMIKPKISTYNDEIQVRISLK